MTRVLLVTNDFPPRYGGIQSYLVSLVDKLTQDYSHKIVVYAPKYIGHQTNNLNCNYHIIRHPAELIVPNYTVAAYMSKLIIEYDIETVWFGNGIPLALLGATARRAGAMRIIASTHGHEIGWAMFPVTRSVLHYIGNNTDVITFVSKYAKKQFALAFGFQTILKYIPPGVDNEQFSIDNFSNSKLRSIYGLKSRPLVLCLSRLVPRKGQDSLIKAWPKIKSCIAEAVLIISGNGPYINTLRKLAKTNKVYSDIIFTGEISNLDLPSYYTSVNIFAMPCRTRRAGLDVEGLGITYLEASASSLPVIAGYSGGASETVLNGKTGYIISGNNIDGLAITIENLLDNLSKAKEMGREGRKWTLKNWQWRSSVKSLSKLLSM